MIKKLGWGIFSFVFLSFFYLVLYQIYSPRVNAFGCFDDCFNYVAGYFLLKGKSLYSEIFFNHQPLMAYLSYFIQRFTQPINIYELVLRHRQAVFGFGFLMNLLITWRFGLAGLGFALFYETSKFYLFGDRFLAEGLIVYPLVYLTGLIWFKCHSALDAESRLINRGSMSIDSRFRGNDKQKVYSFEYFLTAFFVWLVVFARLPFVPLAVVVFWLIIGGTRQKQEHLGGQVRETCLPVGRLGVKKWALVMLVGLTFMTLLLLPRSEYLFNIVTVNLKTKSMSFSLLRSFFYPFYLFFGGEKNIFRNFLVGLDVIFLLLLFSTPGEKILRGRQPRGCLGKFSRKTKLIGTMILLLGLANLRPVEPGRVFYDAFHLLPWYGMFIFLTFLMLADLFFPLRGMAFVYVHLRGGRLRDHLAGVFGALLLTGFLAFLLFSFLFSPQFFPREKIDPHEEFLTHFGHQLQIGEVVKKLSEPTDSLFLDGFDDLIYWQANRLSPYPYSWYTSVMPHIPQYSQARLEMFTHHPPDFYYGSCPDKEVEIWTMPENVRNEYQQLYSLGQPTCLYIRKTKIPAISERQWQKAKEFLYELP